MKYLWTILIFIVSISVKPKAQSSNITIQIDEKLVTQPLYCSMRFDSMTGPVYNVIYLPGELLLDSVVWNKINSDTTKPIWFHFSNPFNLKSAGYVTALTRKELKKDYLIISVFDFSNKKYKRWYQWLTDKNFIIEKGFYESGIYLKHH